MGCVVLVLAVRCSVTGWASVDHAAWMGNATTALLLSSLEGDLARLTCQERVMLTIADWLSFCEQTICPSSRNRIPVSMELSRATHMIFPVVPRLWNRATIGLIVAWYGAFLVRNSGIPTNGYWSDAFIIGFQQIFLTIRYDSLCSHRSALQLSRFNEGVETLPRCVSVAFTDTKSIDLAAFAVTTCCSPLSRHRWLACRSPNISRVDCRL